MIEKLFSKGRDSLDKELIGYTVQADKLFIHPYYLFYNRNQSVAWDYCLIRLSKELEFDSKVNSIGSVSKV